MRRFELVEGTSSKFWAISLEDSSFEVRWGKIGTDGQSQVKSFPSADKARSEHDKLVAEKTKKGYSEVGSAAIPAAAAPAAKAPSKPAAKADPPPPPAATDGWLDAGHGYAVAIQDGKVVARSPKGKVLASLPKEVRGSPVVEQLADAVEWLTAHDAECIAQIEAWMLRSLPAPRAALIPLWPDPAWQKALANCVVAPVRAGKASLRDAGVLRAVESGRGFGVATLDGDTRWLAIDAVLIPHPVLLADRDDWRALVAELGATQGVPQLFRETFVKPVDSTADDVDTWSGANFEMLNQAFAAARLLGYRVSGGAAICRVWEGGALVEARYELGDEDPMYETTTGSLSWLNARGERVPVAGVGPVAYSEGMRMASLIHAKRTPEEEESDA
jgi:predicted DNA-binding WGR domain protein